MLLLTYHEDHRRKVWVASRRDAIDAWLGWLAELILLYNRFWSGHIIQQLADGFRCLGRFVNCRSITTRFSRCLNCVWDTFEIGTDQKRALYGNAQAHNCTCPAMRTQSSCWWSTSLRKRSRNQPFQGLKSADTLSMASITGKSHWPQVLYLENNARSSSERCQRLCTPSSACLQEPR